TKEALTRFNNKHKILNKILKKFSENYKNFESELKESFESKDKELTKRLVHTLKGLAGTICATELYKISIETDEKLSKKLISNDIKDYKLLLSELNEVLNELNNFDFKDEKQTKQVDVNLLSELSALKQKLLDADYDAINILERIQENITEGYKNYINEIAKNIKKFDFEKAKDKFDEFINKEEIKLN
ncbi:MAG TPA: hypothetical protein DEP28_08050, partial [Bacteroidetes bacterium]|nr:hypothetical protein [Bacteroidota bacterium]